MNSTSGRFNFTHSGEVNSLQESANGSISVWTRNNYRVTLAPDGTVDTVWIRPSESDVVVPDANRNWDCAPAPGPSQGPGGRVSLFQIFAHTGPDGKVTNSSDNGAIRIVKRSESGSIIWDQALMPPVSYNERVTIIPVRDGGYIAVVMSAEMDKIPTVTKARTPVVTITPSGTSDRDG